MGNNAPRPLRGSGTRIEEDIASIKHLEVSYSSVKFQDPDSPFNENKSLSCYAVSVGKSKQKYSLKLFKDPVDPKTFWMEVLFLRRLHHPNVSNLKGHIFSDNRSGVLVEYSDYGTLFDLLHLDRFKQFRPLPLELQLQFAKDIALGLDYLRSLGVIHKRLRSSNIVVKSLDLSPGSHLILSDFGSGPQDADHEALSFAPTLPPTSKFASHYNTLDVYAFGILLWEMITCELPLSYAPKASDSDVVGSGPLPDIPPTCPRELANIMKLCWHPDPNQRLDLVEIIDALLCIEEKYVAKVASAPPAAKLGAMSIGYRNQRTRMARLERLAKLIRFCEEVASKNVDVTDLLIVLSESTIALQGMKFISNDDLRKFDVLVDEYETILPIEVGSAKDQQSFWNRFNSKKKSRAAIEKLNGRMQQLISEAQLASESALTSAVAQYQITENVDKILSTAVPNFVRAPRSVLGPSGGSTSSAPTAAPAPRNAEESLDESLIGTNTTSVDDDGEHYVKFETVSESLAGANTISGESASPLPPVIVDDAEIPTRVIPARSQVGRIVVIPTRTGRSSSSVASPGPVERSGSTTAAVTAGGEASEDSSSTSENAAGESSAMSSSTVEPLSPRHYAMISPRRPRADSFSMTPLALQRRPSVYEPPMRSARVSLIDELEAAMLDILEAHSPRPTGPRRSLSPSASEIAPSSPVSTGGKPSVETIAEETEDSEDSSSSSDSDSDSSESSSSSSSSDNSAGIDDLLSRLKSTRPVLRIGELTWDTAAKEFWINNFGMQTSSVEWSVFIKALSGSISMTEVDQVTLKKILDHNNAQYVTVHTFTQFLHGHGPLPRMVEKLNSYTTQPWFHWYLDHDESTILMKHSPARTFVVRFSKSNPGHFALTIKLENGTTEKWLVESHQGKVRASFAQADLPSFETIADFVQHYKRQGFVRHPLALPWTSASWFLGLVDGAETLRLLLGRPVGTYLMRLSGNGDYFVAAYVLPEGIVQEKVQWPAATRFVVENWEGVKEYQCPDLTDFIAARSDRLKYPLSSSDLL